MNDRGRAWVAFLLALLILPVDGLAQPEASATRPKRTESFGWLDAGLLAGGAGLVGLGTLGLSPRKQVVPDEGLDRDDIALEWDRSSIRWRTHKPISVSHWLLAGSQVHPSLVGMATSGRESRARVELQTLTYQVEAFLLAEGISFVLKKSVSRPRPYTYLPLRERSEKGANWATSNQTFESFPSGHAATAWASSTVAVTSLATRRPDLGRGVHFVNGLIAGGFAMSTSLLRVDAGMHFPSDAVAGAAVGAGTGTLVPMLHRRFKLGPGEGRALRWGWLGVGSGSLLALLLTPPTSPWID
jgi:membrane-associated phospholipid phosphatase